MAKIISSSDTDLEIAAVQINDGGLVAFPTETVYGLGARLNDPSLAEIFATKKRPYSDPLITHFATAEAAKAYVILTEEENILFDKLAAAFWPGPLTIVAPATSAVPPLVMAGTGCVGVRVPSHPIAHRFLELCKEPVAAPSANLFGHISPTTPEHVFSDLGFREGLLIISGGCATIGIESTVIRISGSKITILRPGFITAHQIEALCPGFVCSSVDMKAQLASPGHETRHYAPDMPTYMIKKSDSSSLDSISLTPATILIDFNRTYSDLSSKVLRYFDLSPIGSMTEAIHKVYQVLREAEETEGAQQCVIADIEDAELPTKQDAELVASLRDRLLRSASHMIRVLTK